MNLAGIHPCVCSLYIESVIRMHTKDAKILIPVLIIS